MSRAGSNTQGTGGAGTGSGSGGSGGGNSGGSGGTRPTKLRLAASLAAVVVGVALLIAPLVDRWSDPATRPGFYLLALLAVYAAAMPVATHVGRRHH